MNLAKHMRGQERVQGLKRLVGAGARHHASVIAKLVGIESLHFYLLLYKDTFVRFAVIPGVESRVYTKTTDLNSLRLLCCQRRQK